MNFPSGDFKYTNLRFGSYEPVSMSTHRFGRGFPVLQYLPSLLRFVLRRESEAKKNGVYGPWNSHDFCEQGWEVVTSQIFYCWLVESDIQLILGKCMVFKKLMGKKSKDCKRWVPIGWGGAPTLSVEFLAVM